MIAPLGHETRDVTVVGALQRHQLRSYLNKAGIEFVPVLDIQRREANALFEAHLQVRGQESFRITATPGEWVKVDEWIERIKEGL